VAAENFKVKKGLEVGTGITANSDGIDVTGIVTATQFQGDGSGLIGVVASGVGVIVKDEGSTVGTAGTINFVGSGVAAAISEGTATVTVGVSTANVVTDSLVVAGVATATSFESTVSTGTAPFVVASSTKVTNLNADILDDKSTANGAVGNSVVVRNAAAGFSANDVNFQSIVGTALSVAGITTFSDDIHFHGATGITSITYDKSANELRFKDNVRLKFGDHSDLHIYHSGSGSIIREQGTGDLVLTAQDLILQNVTNGATMGQFVAGGAVKLFFNGQQKFTTTGSGIEVPDLSVTGVGTIGRVDVNGLVFGTNATTFAAKFPDSAVANFGSNNELQISHATNISRIQSDNDILYLKGLGINFYKGNSSELFAKFVDDEQVELYYNGSKTFETTGVGASCVGIMSATSFVKTGGTSSQFLMADGSTSAGGGGGGGVTVKDEGSALSTTGTTLNFVGSGVVASGTGAEKTITIAGGSSQNVFSTIAVSGQSNVVADSATDTLTFAAGSNVTLTTNAGTDTVTIAAANDNTQLSNEQVQDIVGAMFSGNTETDITATYEDADGTIDLVVDLSSLNANNLDSGTIPNGRFPTTLPVVSGANLTSLNASEITSGTLPIARIADNAVTFAKMQDVGTGVLIGRNGGGSGDMETLSASEVRTLLNVADGATAGITTAASNFQVTFEILSTSSNSNGYRFSGPGNDGADPNPDLYLVRGQKYRFINNSGGSHPFQIRSSAGGSAYNTGVENNGANSGNIDFNVQHDAPTRLYYQCTSHGGMVGNIYITGGASWQTTDVNTSTAEEIFTLLNVGVGKNDPNYKLDVDGDAKVSGTLFLRDTAGNIGKIIDSGGNLDLYADGTIRFFESDANKEMIRFDINSNNDDGRMSFEGDTDTYFNHPGDNQLGFTIGGTDTLRLKDGNVGIGTATPTDILDINSDSASAVTNMYLRNHANLGGAALSLYAQGTYASPTYRAIIGCSDAGGNIRMGAHSNHDLLLLTNNDAKITIKSDGKVGVGTATPAQKLDVDGTIRFGTSNISSGTHTFTASAGSAVTADTTAVGSCSAVEYTIFVSNSTNIQSQKVLIMDNGTTAYSQEFAMMSNPNMIATFSADVSGSNVRLLATPETGISGSTTIKFTKTIIE
jgi:type II secretory pathway component PulC